ncbi:MAG TPA: hypothetical protein VEF89_30275 [Solirubrobacteraceae bacterium]|nr:hypothetical protein [Solirubrobacteraceae bacterium]
MTSCTLTDARSLLEPVGEGRTLDDLLVALWEGLGSDRAVECPLCEGEMRPVYGAHARAIGGECATCGSTLQ